MKELSDVARILAYEQALEALVGDNLVNAGAVVGLADADDSRVGMHLHEDPWMRMSHQDRTNMCDFHLALTQ